MNKRNALLWEVHFDDIFKGYIFGTMHVSADIAFSDLTALHHAIEECSVFAPEIPLQPSAQEEMGKHLFLPKSTPLQHLVSSRKYEKMKLMLKKSFGIDLDQFDRVMPLFLLNYMTQLSLQSTSSDPADTMDYQLWSYAESQEKQLRSMESIEGHIETLYQIPIEYQLASLRSSLANVSKFRKKTLQLLELYKSQQVHKLFKLSRKSIGSIKDVLLYDRNATMSDNFIELSSDSSVFAAVGAAHLSGKKGLLHLLQLQGYQIKPISIG